MSTDINTSTSNVSTSASSMTLTKRYGMIALFAVLALFMGAKLTGALVSAPAGNGASMHGMYTYQTTTLGAPTDVLISGSATTGSLTVTWVNPGTTGAAITSYTVTDATGNQVLCTQTTVGALGAANSCTWTPTSSTKYAGRIHVQSNGSGVTSVPDGGSVDTLAVPSAPTSTPTISYVTAGKMKLTFNTVSATIPVTSYGVYWNNTLVCTAAGSAAAQTSCSIDVAANGLNYGQSYQFGVVAINAAGNSISSLLSAGDIAKTNPGSVTGLSAAYNSAYGTVDVSYTAPSSNGGSALTYSYYVNGTTSITCGAAVVVGPKCSITLAALATLGLSPFNGAITVVATNGTSAGSYLDGFTSITSSNSIFVGNVPNAPATNVISLDDSTFATYGTDKVIATWTVPSAGAEVNGYTAQLQTCTSATPGTTVTCTNSGSPKFLASTARTTYFSVAPGAIYTISISATNFAGSGPALVGKTSGSLYQAIAAREPSAPAVSLVSATNNSITYTFAAPSDSGSPISGYSVQLLASGVNSGSPVTKTVAGTYTVSGLAAGYVYDIAVKAINALGTSSAGSLSDATSTGSVTIGLAPSATAPVITYNATGATISWTPQYIDAYGDTATVASYTVIDNGQVLCTSTTTSCTVTSDQLKAQLARLSSAGVNFYVFSTDANGVTSNPTTTTAILAPNQVADSVTSRSDGLTTAVGNVNVSWTAGSVTDGSPAPTSYTIVVRDTVDASVQSFTASATATSYLISGSSLNPLHTYTVSVVANAATGSSAARSSASISDAAGLAAKPTTVKGINDGNGNFVTISWTSGGTTDGNATTSYTAMLTAANGNSYTCTTPATATKCTIYGVATNTAYSATVVANGPLGNSAATTAVTINSTGISAPAVITSVTSADTTHITVTFTTPSSTPSAIAGFIAVFDDGKGNLSRGSAGGQMANFGSLYPEKYSCGNVLSALGGSLGGSVANSASLSCTVTVPAGLTSYTVNVILIEKGAGFSASDKVGINVVSSASVTATNKAVPSQLSAPVVAAVSSTGKITITFTAPTSANGTVDYYNFTVTNATSGKNAIASGSGASTDACTLPTGIVAGGLASLTNTANSTTTFDIRETLIDGKLYPITCQFTAGTSLESLKVTAVAHNESGTSLASSSSAAVTPVALAAPTTVSQAGTATTGYTIAWSAVTGATSYTVTGYNGSSPVTYTGITTTNTVVPSSVLSTGNSYRWTVTPVGSLGAGTESAQATDKTGVAVSAPSFTYYADSSSAQTKATLLIVNNDTTKLPVTYNVYATVAGVPILVGSGVSSPYTFSYVTGYSAAAITVYAVTAAGSSSAASVTGSAIVGALAPTAPTFVSAVPGATGTTVVLTWTNVVPVATTGTPAITAATAQLISPTGTVIACPTIPAVTLGASDGTCTFSGLTSNTIYSFSITTTDVTGTSTATVGTVVTLTTAPGAPTITGVTSTTNGYDALGSPNIYVKLTWSAPTVTGGSAITGYLVSITNTGTSATTYCSTVLTSTSTTCSISATAGATYMYSVRALNAGGLGTEAASLDGSATAYTAAKNSIVLPAAADVPAAPTQFTSLLGGVSTWNYPAYGSVKVYFVPGTDNASAVTGFTCYAKATGYTTVSTTVPVVVGQTAPYSCTLTGLSNTPYTITVKANNPYNGGSQSEALTITNTASDGTVTTKTSKWVANSHVNFGGASVVGGTISVQWVAPAVYPGTVNDTKVTGYTATATDAAGNSFTCTGTATDRLCTIKGLANATTYSVTVVATFEAGVSTSYETVAIKTLAGSAPSAPAVTGVVSTATGLSVTWTAPTTVGSGQLVGYWVVATDSLNLQQSTCPYNATYGVILSPAVTCTITGLVHDDAYTISVTAITMDGAGNKQLSAAGTKAAVFTAVAPEPVIATFMAVTAKQKSVSALSANAKSALNNLISVMNDGANVTVAGYGTTKAIALARANAAANYLFKNGAAVHVTVKTVVSKTVKTALVTVTKN